jgi:hypothetical protein
MRLRAETYEQILAQLKSDSHREKDKRREPRVGLAAEADYVMVNEKGKRVAGVLRVRDVSVSGVGLVFPQEMPKKQRFVVQLKKKNDDPLWLICLTAHCRKVDGNFYSVGARIEQVLRADAVRKIEAQTAAASASAAVKSRPAATSSPADVERISKAILS